MNATPSVGNDLSVVLEYRSARRSSIQNWSGPGWYVFASTSDDHGQFAIEPRRISPDGAQDIAEAFGQPVAKLATMQRTAAYEELAARVARLESVERELAEARAELEQHNRESMEGGS